MQRHPCAYGAILATIRAPIRARHACGQRRASEGGRSRVGTGPGAGRREAALETAGRGQAAREPEPATPGARAGRAAAAAAAAARAAAGRAQRRRGRQRRVVREVPDDADLDAGERVELLRREHEPAEVDVQEEARVLVRLLRRRGRRRKAGAGGALSGTERARRFFSEGTFRTRKRG